jgi:hypothetical protein
MNYNTESLKITLRTNFNTSNPKERDVVFSLDMLKHPKLQITGDMKKTPIFSYAYEYPYDLLMKLPFQDRVRFFFSEKFHREFINKNRANVRQAKSKLEIVDESEQNSYYSERSDIIKQNVLTTLKVLFNTSPYVNNVSTSYDYVINEGPTELNFPSVIGLFVTPENSHLELKGRTFNFAKLIWLNDILNNPEYYALFAEYIKFNAWFLSQKQTLNVKLKNIKTKISGLCENVVTNAVEYLKQNVSEQKEGTKLQLIIMYSFLKTIIDDNIMKIDSYSAYITMYNKIAKNIKARLVITDEIQPPRKEVVDRFMKNFLFTGKTNTELVSSVIAYIESDDAYKVLRGKASGTLRGQIDKINADISNIIKLNKSDGADRTVETIDYVTRRFSELDQLKRVTKDENKRNMANSTPNEYLYFIQAIEKYQSNQKETSNAQLQQVIDLKTQNDVMSLFSFFDSVYNYYIEGTAVEMKKEDLDLLDMGAVLIIPKGYNSSKERSTEIYVLCDLTPIDQKTTENLDKQDCKKKDENLGKLLEQIIDDRSTIVSIEKNRYKWDVDRNRPMIELNPSSSSTTNQQSNQSSNNAQRANNTGSSVSDQDVDFNFKKVLANIKDLNKYIDAVNFFQLEEPLNDYSLLNYLKSNKSKEGTALFGLAQEFATNVNKFSSKLSDKLVYFKSELTAKMEVNKNAIATRFREGEMSLEKRKLEFENAKLVLFSQIADQLLKEENKKDKSPIRGGKRRRTRNKKVSRTRKTRKF